MKKIIYPLCLCFVCFGIIFFNACTESSDSSGSETGIGGSLARFTIACDKLFIVDNEFLHIVDIAEADNPIYKNKLSVGLGIETIFGRNEILFIGANDGFYIFDINNCNDPQPTYASKLSHVYACDPVVANNEYAYVTLRSGGDCRIGWTNNELDIFDISDIYNPSFLKLHPMIEPWGLGVDGNILFICQNNNGLMVYDVSDPMNLIEINSIDTIAAMDCIPRNDRLLITGSSGFYQYNYSNIDSIYFMSKIKKGE